MKRTTIAGIILTLILLSMLTLAFDIQSVKAEPTTWIVDNDGPADFHTIQEAINAASSGDTVLVKEGTYYENVAVNKTVSLFGENIEATIIDGNETGDCVSVTASSAKISGFTIQNGGSRPFTAYASVRLFTSGNSILNNNLIDSWCGVRIEHHSDYNLIANNTITGNLNGIAGELWHNTEIMGNTIENNLMGIWIGPYSQNNVVSFNNINDHWSEGIMMMQSSSNTFEGNNIVDNNQGGFWAGITIGFQKGFSSDNKFFHNNIANMGKQIELQGESEPIIWDDGYPSGGNHWSDFATRYPSAQELDDSGLWDTSYIIDANNRDRYPLMNPWALTPTIVTATIEIDPDTLNLRSKANWITAYVQLPEGYDPADIDASTILLNGTITPVLDANYGFVTNSSEYLVDHNNDGVLERMVKFDRVAVESFIVCQEISNGNAALTITGKSHDGTQFEGRSIIFVTERLAGPLLGTKSKTILTFAKWAWWLCFGVPNRFHRL